ncbi:MAG: hypothetical protein JWN14_218, partial [Chthonomonadales bacterium]|nr:hypothetical protein [Chthonomonadales bacterium]
QAHLSNHLSHQLEAQPKDIEVNKRSNPYHIRLGSSLHASGAKASQQLQVLSTRYEEAIEAAPPLLSTSFALGIKVVQGGRVSVAGNLSLNSLRQGLRLEVQPASLAELLREHPVIISAVQANGQHIVFSDRLISFNDDMLHFAYQTPFPVDAIRELVILVGDPKNDLNGMAALPPPPGAISLAENLPHCFGKTCIVWYRNPTGDVRTFTDRLHSYTDNHAYFRHHMPISAQDLIYISCLEDVQENNTESSELPLWDPDPIWRSVP